MAAAGSLASGLGMIAGVAGPIAIAAMALASLDKKSTSHVGGYVLVDAQGRVTDATAQQGGRQQADTQAAVATLAQSLLGTLNAGSKGVRRTRNNTVRAVFESDSNDPSWALFHLLNDKGVKLAGSVDALGTLSMTGEGLRGIRRVRCDLGARCPAGNRPPAGKRCPAEDPGQRRR